jgi:hypothetical protein
MMDIFPTYSEILVSSLSCEEVARKIGTATKMVNYLDGTIKNEKNQHFSGEVDHQHFRLSLIINKADSFLPLINGKIEPTKRGCILFLKYSLFPSSVFFLAFWGILSLLLALFFVIHENQWLNALISILAGAGNFLFAWSYFKTKLKQSQLIFHQMLSLQEKN